MGLFRLTAALFLGWLCTACSTPEVPAPFVTREPSRLLKILEEGTLNVSTFYNTTDFYVHQGVTKGFHYELAKDFADYLGVKLKVVEINNNVDTAVERLGEGRYDLLAMSLTQTPERRERLCFSQPFFHTAEVLVQNGKANPVRHPSALNGQAIFIPCSAVSYKKALQHLQDSLNLRIDLIEVDQHFNEDLLHLVETGTIPYTVTDENIARAAGFSMKNIDYTFRLQDSIAISWATLAGEDFLAEEIDRWLQTIRKSGKLRMLYQRYFNNRHSVPANGSKYTLLKKGKISVYDHLLKKASRRLDWDWRLLAAIAYVESHFEPEAESSFGAYGLMQVMPETAGQFGVTDYFTPEGNVHAGVSYLKYLNDYFTPYIPAPEERIKFILASYNAGPGHVMDAIRLASKYGKDPLIWDNNVDYYLLHKNERRFYQDSLAKNGYCNGPQAYHYVHRVLETYNNYKNINQ